MKCKTCMNCFSPAAYESKDLDLRLCEKCYTRFLDYYETFYSGEIGLSLDEFYEIEEIDCNCDDYGVKT